MSMGCGLDVAMGTLLGGLMTTVFWKVPKSAWSFFFQLELASANDGELPGGLGRLVIWILSSGSPEK